MKELKPTQLGRIKLSFEFLQQPNKQVLSALFTEFFPVFITMERYYEIEYYGLCSDFEEIKEGETIPYYSVIVHEIVNVFSVQFKKL